MFENINMIFTDFDEHNYFIRFEKESEDIGLKFVLNNFIDDLGYWDISVSIVEKDGKTGFAISKSISRKLIELEIKRFVKQFDLDK